MHPRLRLLAWILGTALLALPLALAVAAAALHSPAGERLAARLAAEALSGPGRRVAIEGLTIDWPFRLAATTVRVADDQGPWLTVRRPILDWDPEQLIAKMIDIDALAAEVIEVARPPLPPPEPGPPLSIWPLPAKLPFTLRLKALALPVVLEPPVAGERVMATLTGTATVTRGGGDVALTLRDDGGSQARMEGTAGRDFLDLRWYLEVPHLARWQGLAGLPLAGRLSASGVIAGRLPQPVITASIDLPAGRAGSLAWTAIAASGQAIPQRQSWRLSLQATATAPRLDGGAPLPTVDLALAGDLQPATGSARLGLLRLTTAAGSLAGFGAIADWGRDTRLLLSLSLPRLPAPATAGAGRATIHLAGDLLTPRLAAVVEAHAAGLATGTAALDRLLGPAPRASATLTLRRWSEARLTLARVEGRRATLWAEGMVGRRMSLWTAAALPDLAAIAGGVSGTATAGGRVAGSSSWGVLRSDALRAAGLPNAAGAAAWDLRLSPRPKGVLTAALASGPDRVEGTATLAEGGLSGRVQGRFPDLSRWSGLAGVPLAGTAEADAAFDHRGITLSVTAAGTPELPAGLAAGGRIQFAGGGGTAVIERLRLAYAGTEARLLAPADLRWRPGTTVLEPARLALGDGVATLGGSFGRDRLDGTARLDGVALGLIGLVAPDLDAVGRIGGTVTVTGSPQRPEITASLEGRGIGFAAAARAGIGNLTATLAGHWRDGRAEATLAARDGAQDGNRLRLRAEGSVPLTAAGLVPRAPLQVNLSLNGDLGQLTDGLPLGGNVLGGRLEAAGSIGGSVDEPRIDGTAQLHGGHYENLDQGTLIAGIEATATAAGDRIGVEATGSDGGGGRVRLAGSGDIAGHWRATAGLAGFRLVRRDDATATVSADLELAGSGRTGRLSGRGSISQAEIDIGRLKGGGPAGLEVIEINKPGATPPPMPEAVPHPLELDLALEVAVEHAFLRRRGLQSEWEGGLTVAGTTEDPRIAGRLTVVRGDYDLLGRSFRLTRDSAILFAGNPAPELAVTAEAHAGDILARVAVRGPAAKPDIDFTSDPPLPRDEVISRLVFGKGAGGLSAFQQLQLGRLAAGTLTGEEGGGFDPLSELRGVFGLDVLDVGVAERKPGATTDRGGPTLSAGKYVGADTFVRVEQGTSGLGRVVVEQELGGGFSVETSVGQQAGGSAGFNWRKDY